MKHDCLVMVGESYMQPFTDAGGHASLADIMGIPHYNNLVFPGSAIDQCMRALVDYCCEHQGERLLVVWGLTFVSRFDLLTAYQDNPFKTRWTSFNGDSFNALRPSQIQDHDKMLEAARSIAGVRAANGTEVLKEYLRKVVMTAGFLDGMGHDYLIYSQTKMDLHSLQETEPVYQYIKHNPRFLDIFTLAVNTYLQENGVEPSRFDLETFPNMPREFAHPTLGPELNQVLGEFILRKYQEIYR